MEEGLLREVVPGVLAAIPADAQAPHAAFVPGCHSALLERGLEPREALHLLDDMATGGRPGGREIAKAYRERFGADDARGWDKVMHFVKSARLALDYGMGVALLAGVGKEVYDQLEHWWSKERDPVGWSNADLSADMQGVLWGLSIRD